MSHKNRPWRKIHRRDTNWSEKASLTSRTFSWSATYEHKLTLECGHTQIRRGYSQPPSTKVICKDCEAGKEPVSIEGIEPGVFDKTRKTAPKGAAIVDAMISNERERMKDQSQEAMRERAKERSPDYPTMSPEEQWAEDKRLGILDWDGR